MISSACPHGSVLGAHFSTRDYATGPIQVNAGRFRVETDVLDDYNVVTHVVIVGFIRGNAARGTVSSTRVR